MKVKLLTNGGYTDLDACIGKEFLAKPIKNSNSVDLLIKELEGAGGTFRKEGNNRDVRPNSIYACFFEDEVEVIDEN